MPDRLAELLRQRTLLQEHLAWLNREIADAEKSAVRAVPTIAPPPPAPSLPPFTAGAVPKRFPGAALPSSAGPLVTARVVDVAGAPPVDEIFEQYRVPARDLQQNVRKGCLLYFVGAFALLGVVVVILYLAIGRR